MMPQRVGFVIRLRCCEIRPKWKRRDGKGEDSIVYNQRLCSILHQEVLLLCPHPSRSSYL